MNSETETKTCNICQETKFVDEFYWRTSHGGKFRYRRECCKLCWRKKVRTRLACPIARRKWTNSLFLRKYGITLEEYEELFKLQKGRCKICNKKSKIRLPVDHDHKTGRVRGLLCSNCNLLLGAIERDGIEIVLLAIQYLKQQGA